MYMVGSTGSFVPHSRPHASNAVAKEGDKFIKEMLDACAWEQRQRHKRLGIIMRKDGVKEHSIVSVKGSFVALVLWG